MIIYIVAVLKMEEGNGFDTAGKTNSNYVHFDDYWLGMLSS